jgi:hypothetical protein
MGLASFNKQRRNEAEKAVKQLDKKEAPKVEKKPTKKAN